MATLEIKVLYCFVLAFAGLYLLVVNYSDSVEPLNSSCQTSMLIFLVFINPDCVLD